MLWEVGKQAHSEVDRVCVEQALDLPWVRIQKCHTTPLPLPLPAPLSALFI